MSSETTIELASAPSPPISRVSTSASLRFLLACAGREQRRQRDESSSTDSSSSDTVVRETSSWRWMIVFGSFCVHFVADGVLFSFGILMHLIKDDLKLELHTVGMIASLFVSLPLLLAPVSGALVNKIGCRAMTMFGGFVCSLGLVFASWMGNFPGALIGIGIVCGMGLSCVYVPAVVIVAHYFDENRAIATAIAVGGTGLTIKDEREATFAFAVLVVGLGNALIAQLIHYLNDYYGDWRETTLVLAGVLFTIVAFGVLFRPVEFFIHRKKKNSHYIMNDTRLPPSCMTSVEKLQRFVQAMDKQRAARHRQESTGAARSLHETNEDDLYDSYSADDVRELEDEISESLDMNALEKKMQRFPMPRLPKFMTNPNDKTGTTKHVTQTGVPATPLSRAPLLVRDQVQRHLLEVYNQPISQKDIFYRGNVPIKTSTLSRTSCPDLLRSYVYEESAASISDDTTVSTRDRHRRYLFYRKGLSFLNTLRRMIGLQLFRDYRYVIFFLSQFLFYLFYELIYLFPVDYGEKVIGYSKTQMTRAVTVLGIGQLFGQILFGILANYSPIDELILYDIGAMLCGIASFLIPFVARSYTALITAVLVFGLGVSANYALTSIILANMCGLESLTSAYGLVLFGQGLSSLFGPVIGGWIAEHYGYKASLMIAGSFMSLSGFVTMLIPFLQCLPGKEKNTNLSETGPTNTASIQSDSSE